MKNSRRDFIKTSALFGAAALVSASPFGSVLANSTGKKVKLGVIGTGGRGRYLSTHLLKQKLTSDFEIIALCDNYQPSLNKALKVCKDNKISPKTYTDYRQLIKDSGVDGVIIATPLFTHAHITIDCLNAGIHVLCEKSMARTLEDTKAMYDAHIKSGAILLIGHQRLFNQKYLHAMDQIHKGELGAINQIKAQWHRNNDWRRKVPKDKPELERQINWRLYKEYSAGLYTELMSHQLQVSNWALQKLPTSVMSTGSISYYKDGREVPDNVAAIFEYDDGTHFLYDTITSNKLEGCEERINGDLGTMFLETNVYKPETPPKPKPAPGIMQLVNDIQEGLFKEVPIGGASWAPETALKHNGVEIYKGQEGDGTREELVSFIGFIQQHKAPEWLLREGYNASIWTLLTEQAMETGMKVSCPEKYVIS